MSDSGRGKCAVPAGDGLLGAIQCLTAPDADCEVAPNEPCYLRQSHNYVAVAVAFELLAMLRQWPGGSERLSEMRSRWLAEPEASAASLSELLTRPIPASPDTDDRPVPGQYL